MSKKRLVLAFDIERAGPTLEYDTIAIGASVVNQDFEELGSFFFGAYRPGKNGTIFESLCKREFWSQHADTLEKLKIADQYAKASPVAIEQAMITGFQAFRLQWETYAAANGYKFELASDNNVFDGGFVNHLIFYMDQSKHSAPIPFNRIPRAKDGAPAYGCFWETYSMQRGLLLAVDPAWVPDNDYEYSGRIKELYDVPAKASLHAHDHLPHHDAFTIACDLQILHAIGEGRIVRKIKTDQ